MASPIVPKPDLTANRARSQSRLRRFSIAEVRGYLLATRVGGEPLDHGHGAPVRLVAPGRRGFEWVKWVDTVTLNTGSEWWQPPFPLT